MKKYIIWIDSLITTFSIVESGKDIVYNYQDKDNDSLFDAIDQGDVILGYYAEPINKVVSIFVVKDKTSGNILVLNKMLETAEGTTIEDKVFVSNLEEKSLIELSDDQYYQIVDEMVKSIEIYEGSNVTEDIFSGFEPWLTSPNNPDYTGKQKYGGYARALVKLVDFMLSKNLIEDTDLNDKNIEKYISWVQIYEGSQEAKDL